MFFPTPVAATGRPGLVARRSVRHYLCVPDGGATDAHEWKSERADPYLGMQVGHTRQDVGAAEDGPFLPPFSEQPQRDDLVVLDQDLFSVDKYAIHKTRPSAVIVGGKLVFGKL